MAALTDEMIVEAFRNTNFGSDDFKGILLNGVKKTAIGHHNGGTLTRIIRELGLGVADKDGDGNHLTEAGLQFIVDASTEKSEKEVARLTDKYQKSEAYIKKMDAVIDGKGLTRSCINPLEDLTNAINYAVNTIAAQAAEIKQLQVRLLAAPSGGTG